MFLRIVRVRITEQSGIKGGKTPFAPNIFYMQRRNTMKLQQLMSYTRRAIDDYGMIQSGDKIAIGLSGGKDSLTLLYALHGLQRFYPEKFDLEAITVDLGHPDFDVSRIRQLCESMGVPYTVVKTEIAQIVFDERKEKNPCSLCAKMRKGALNDAIKKLGCNKIAYAHHKDDIVETMMMSLIYEGHFYSFPPITHLDRTDLTVIRPLMYVYEADVKGFCNKYQLPVVKSPCPADGYTKRQYVKDMLRKLNQETPGVKERMFSAIVNGNIPDWTPKIR